jgi:hypothetical protein
VYMKIRWEDEDQGRGGDHLENERLAGLAWNDLEALASSENFWSVCLSVW